jgi:hypothetical protein
MFDTAMARWDMRGKNSNGTSCGTNGLRAEIDYAVAQHISPNLKMAFRVARAPADVRHHHAPAGGKENRTEEKRRTTMNLCPSNKPLQMRLGEAKTLEEYIRLLEEERDRVVAEKKSPESKAEAQEFYDRLIAKWKKRDHLCKYDPNNGFACPICGDTL